MTVYFAPESSFIPPEWYEGEELVASEELADAALELEVGRTCRPEWNCDCEDCQRWNNKGEDTMTLQEIHEAITAAIPNHGNICLGHTLSDGTNFYSGWVCEPTSIEGARYQTPTMAMVVQAYQPEALLQGLLDSYSRYVPDRLARLETLRKQIAEIEGDQK